jgi:5-methylcytosine-specific restriction enzyme A
MPVSAKRKSPYSWKWQNYRIKFLREWPYRVVDGTGDHAACEDHRKRGMAVRAIVVDHKIPHRGDETLFWDPKNHQPLCKTCHDSAKQREEKSGIKPGCTTSGIPLDANHHWNKRNP